MRRPAIIGLIPLVLLVRGFSYPATVSVLEPCLERYELLVYAVTGGGNAPCVGVKATGGGAFIMLRLLRRRPRTGGVGVPLTVDDELTECIDSSELLLPCWTLPVGTWDAIGSDGLTARQVLGVWSR
jgi:hypothetical protein